jgi:hypothetical protein
MLNVQCTKKLAEELKIIIQKECATNVNPLYSWHAHVFFHNRRKCVLVMNNMTRYNFVLYGLKREDFKGFDNIIIKGIRENFIADGISSLVIEKYLQHCKEVCYGATSDRSIISQMNEMIMVSKLELEEYKRSGAEPDLNEINRCLNRFVMLKLPEIYSLEAMRDSLCRI